MEFFEAGLVAEAGVRIKESMLIEGEIVVLFTTTLVALLLELKTGTVVLVIVRMALVAFVLVTLLTVEVLVMVLVLGGVLHLKHFGMAIISEPLLHFMASTCERK